MYIRIEFIPGKMKGDPDQNLLTSMRMYMMLRRKKAMLPVAITKLMDQRFLLIGMTPEFLVNPHRAPATRPVITAQTSQRVTRAFQLLWTRSTFPAAAPSQQRNTQVRVLVNVL